MRDRAILRAFAETPWAILPSKYEQIVALLERHAAGDKPTKEEIHARLGGGPAPRPSPSKSGAVAVLPVYGVISQRMNLLMEMSGGTSTEILGKQIDALADDPGIKAIVLDVNSPGGSVFGVTELAAKIRSARERKHVVAVANSLAASAAYNIAAQASEVVVTPSGLVGSIGVLMEHLDVSKAMEMEGVKPTLIHAGKYKVEGNSYEPLGDEARAHLQAMAEDYYVSFIGDVAEGRRVSRAKVRSDYGQGRVMTAEHARAAGMVDRIATLDEVIEKLVGGKRASGPRAEADEAEPHDTIWVDRAAVTIAVADAFKADGAVAETIAQVTQAEQELAAQAAEQNAAARRRWLELERLR
jgi:signal peptide peptidase SppA